MKPQKEKKSRLATALIAFFFGGFGVHHFYLGNIKRGALYMMFFWTLVPAILALIEVMVFLTMSDETFDAKYNV